MKYSALGKRIRAKRKARSMTLDQLAEAANVSASFLGLIERGARKPSLDTFTRIANALRCDANTLLADSIDCLKKSEDGADAARREITKEILRLLWEKAEDFSL